MPLRPTILPSLPRNASLLPVGAVVSGSGRCRAWGGWFARVFPARLRLRVLILLGAGLLASGCGPGEADPASYTTEQKDAIAEASRAVRQYEDWSDRAEYKIQKHPAGWQVTAWRVEHPEAKGNSRYVPWGYRVIVVDRRGKVIEYKNSK